ncbi:SSI family serine proteinase inhibitor [Kineosporia sp. R_H_3]|uniref:SSI family serine proteinase inhibitor n=1 Tax=Kineosporia sp. R_H_3 TaxID=1961848 RepID=UPI000B4AA9E5|nr:SSI family serine proteinase inhibitor [Kineosporia sp. R_H_3]
MTTRPGHRHRPPAPALVVLAAAATLAACGGGSSAAGGSPVPSLTLSSQSPTAVPTPTASGATSLTVVVVDDGSGPVTWRLECDPPGGDHPDPAAACAALDAKGATALLPVPKDQMCTMVYGGPEKATVEGTWRGNPVSTTFDRSNGCEIARWTALAGLLPAPKN